MRRLQVYTDPFQHAAIAAAVAAPLVPQAGAGVIGTAIASALVIDIDHAIAARSLSIEATTSLPTRPLSHNMLTALGAGALVSAVAGPAHGWAAFGGLASHLMHDAGDRAAPTPVLWPLRPARQLGRRWQLAATMALTLGSVVLSRAMAATSRAPSSASAGDDGAGTRLRTA